MLQSPLKSLSCFIAIAIATPVTAQTPQLQTPSPVIYLADNLDEPDQLGWCIDTLGRGFADRLQAHSCKPQGGDVQFLHSQPDGTIQSVAYSGTCMERLDNDAQVFGLHDCDVENVDQVFVYDSTAKTLSPVTFPNLCVAVGDSFRQAGPFSSRDLILAPCDTTIPTHMQWIISE
jgi:hypothetical protein